MSDQRLGQHRLLAAALERARGRRHELLGLCDAPLREQHACARVVQLREVEAVLERGEEGLRAVEVLVRLGEAAERGEQVAEVVLDARLVARVARLLEVVARGRVLDEGLIYVVFAVLGFAQEVQQGGEAAMEFRLEQVAA